MLLEVLGYGKLVLRNAELPDLTLHKAMLVDKHCFVEGQIRQLSIAQHELAMTLLTHCCVRHETVAAA